MSDGPFRSLPMHPKWRKAAEFADNPAASSDDVLVAVESAMHREWLKEIPVSLIERIKTMQSQPDLFSQEYFDSIRQAVRGKPIANSLLNYLSQTGDADSPINVSLVKAISYALVERSARIIRQIQEHCTRETNNPERSQKVASRMIKTFQELGYDRLAQKFLQPGGQNFTKKSLKKTGLDEGVKI